MTAMKNPCKHKVERELLKGSRAPSSRGPDNAPPGTTMAWQHSPGGTGAARGRHLLVIA